MFKKFHNIPDELAHYSIVTKESPYKYLGVEISDKVARIKYVARLKNNIVDAVHEIKIKILEQ